MDKKLAFAPVCWSGHWFFVHVFGIRMCDSSAKILLGFPDDYLFSILGWLQSRSTHSQQILEENRQAVILFAIIILFVICHLPRMFLNLHEALTFEQKKRDYLNGCRGVPLWILIIGLLSHLLLTCNSALNFILYCAMSEVFRHELFLLLKRWYQTVTTCNGILGKSLTGNFCVFLKGES